MTRFVNGAGVGLKTLLERVATRALDDAGIEGCDLDSVHVGNMAAEELKGGDVILTVDYELRDGLCGHRIGPV